MAMSRTLMIAALLIATACASAPVNAKSVKSIHWKDGDSGVANGVEFRLADVDAPETGGVGSPGGAKCEAERALGKTAKEFIVAATKGHNLIISFNGEVDKWARKVATVTVDGKDLGGIGIAAGHLRPYVFNGNRSTMPKPKWCP